jgi:hypothetical protein
MQGVPDEEPEIGTNTTMLPEHKGMFGVKGNLRDIIGGLGDAFLVQGGKKPVYAERKMQEQTGDAMEGLADTEDDAGNVMDAEALNKRRAIVFERLRKVNPEAAQSLYEKIMESDYKDSFNQARIGVYKDKSRGAFGSLASTANEKNWMKLRPMLERYKAARGLDDIEIPDEYDPDWVEIVKSGAIDPYRSERLEDFDIDLDRKERQGGARVAQGAQRVQQGETRLAQGQERNDIARDRAETYKNTAGKKGTKAPTARPLPQGWTRKEGRIFNAQGIEMVPPKK